jgi:hypothetical protein
MNVNNTGGSSVDSLEVRTKGFNELSAKGGGSG